MVGSNENRQTQQIELLSASVADGNECIVARHQSPAEQEAIVGHAAIWETFSLHERMIGRAVTLDKPSRPAQPLRYLHRSTGFVYDFADRVVTHIRGVGEPRRKSLLTTTLPLSVLAILWRRLIGRFSRELAADNEGKWCGWNCTED